MVSYAIVKDNKVVNRVEAESEDIANQIAQSYGGSVDTSPDAKVGYEYKDGSWSVPEIDLQEKRERMSCSASQFIIGLDEFGSDTDDYLSDVEDYMASETTPRKHKLAWKKASRIDRTGNLVNAAAENLGWSEQFRDDLIEYCMKVKV